MPNLLRNQSVIFFAIVYEISKSVIPLSNSVIINLVIGFEWVIPYVIPYEGYLVAMQFLDLTGGFFFFVCFL
jgi:hypothetical protein